MLRGISAQKEEFVFMFSILFEALYSNSKLFVEAHPDGMRFHKPKNLQMI